jgi:hypothetical protein
MKRLLTVLLAATVGLGSATALAAGSQRTTLPAQVEEASGQQTVRKKSTKRVKAKSRKAGRTARARSAR